MLLSSSIFNPILYDFSRFLSSASVIESLEEAISLGCEPMAASVIIFNVQLFEALIGSVDNSL